VIRLLAPRALRHLAEGRRLVLVSGTNGKTTTSHLIAAAFRTRGAVVHNALGANMFEGALSALATDLDAPMGVLEVDELHLGAIAQACAPVYVVLLNLTRDQLDRASEVRRTASVLAAALAQLPGTTTIANADDPMVVWAARHAIGPRVWVAGGCSWRYDSLNCPSCGQPLSERGGAWRCVCGLARPEPHWSIRRELAIGPRTSVPLDVALPGAVNRGNALTALAVAVTDNIAAPAAAHAIGTVRDVAGRYRCIRRGRHMIRLYLAKNPASWSATISMLEPDTAALIIVNAHEADGKDTSWLWDVDFTELGDRPVIASGRRAADVGLRLSYAEVEHRTVANALRALHELPEGNVAAIANYTAFHQLTNDLLGKS
jgi:UDP-N-acetylmuramyl tripeptide synthase